MYLLPLDTGERQALTNVQGGVLEFDFSADGTQLYYSVNTGRGTALYGKRLLTAPKGAPEEAGQTAPTQAASEPELALACPQADCRAPRVSPAGDFLAYERTPPPGGGEPAYPVCGCCRWTDRVRHLWRATRRARPSCHTGRRPGC